MKFRTLICILILLVLCSCEHNNTDQNKCVPIPECPGDFGWQPRAKYPIMFSSPCFNPENNDEIAAFEHNYTTGEFYIIKYNLITNEKNYILEGNFWSAPAWGKDDWIIFNINGADVYRIKSDGSQFKRLTFSGNCHRPFWNYDYSKIYFHSSIFYKDTIDGKIRNVQEGIGVIMDIEGNISDTVTYTAKESPDGRYMAFFNTFYRIYDVENDSLIEMDIEIDPNLGGSSTVWINNNTLLWSRSDGIYRTDLITKSTVKLKSGCNSSVLYFCDYSTSKDLILCEKVEYKQIGKSDILESDSYFVTMKSDLSEEKRIEIPR